MEDEDAFLIDMPLIQRRQNASCCDYRDCCCIAISAVILIATVALVIATFVFGFKPDTIKCC